MALILGYAALSTPELVIESRTYPSETKRAFGVKPELGLKFGGFTLSWAYQVPVEYKFESGFLSIGMMQYMVGYVFTIPL